MTMSNEAIPLLWSLKSVSYLCSIDISPLRGFVKQRDKPPRVPYTREQAFTSFTYKGASPLVQICA